MLYPETQRPTPWGIPQAMHMPITLATCFPSHRPCVPSTSSSPGPPEDVLGVLANSIREVVFLPDLQHRQPTQLIASRSFAAYCGYSTYCCFVICLCLNPASFWLAGLMIASEGLMYAPLCGVSAMPSLLPPKDARSYLLSVLLFCPSKCLCCSSCGLFSSPTAMFFSVLVGWVLRSLVVSADIVGYALVILGGAFGVPVS